MHNIQDQDWINIRKTFGSAQRAAMHCSIATVDTEGLANISPIGTLFLHEQQHRGFFFDTYLTQLEANLRLNPKACIQAVNSSHRFWLKSLIQGQFNAYPGVRLYGKIGHLRPATDQELILLERRIYLLKWTKGSKLIWSDFKNVRDVHIEHFRWVEYPSMMP